MPRSVCVSVKKLMSCYLVIYFIFYQTRTRSRACATLFPVLSVYFEANVNVAPVILCA